MKIAIGILFAALAAFAGITWAALETGGGVAIVETRAPDGSTRSTHVWFVEDKGGLWLEAGTPENGWYRDVLREPAVGFHTDGRVGRYLAQPMKDRERHDWVRERIAAKYGWRDRWVSLFVDQDHSIAVELALARNRRSPRLER